MKNEVMSGSSRGGKLYALMSAGNPVPNEIVTDIIGEAMVKKADGSKVHYEIIITVFGIDYHFIQQSILYVKEIMFIFYIAYRDFLSMDIHQTHNKRQPLSK